MTKRTRQESGDDIKIENVLTFIYHRNHGITTCWCGELIRGRHQCLLDNTVVNKIDIVECDYQSSEKDNKYKCYICITEEEESRYADQWRFDEDGYCYCSDCGEKCYDNELPKECFCLTYIDREGVRRQCKEYQVSKDE